MQVLRDSDGDLIETRCFVPHIKTKKNIKRPRDAFAFFRDEFGTSTSKEIFNSLPLSNKEKYESLAKKDRERYIRELASSQDKNTTNVWQLAMNRIQSQLGVVRFNEMYLQSYESEGWSRSGNKSKKRKLRPEAELRKARRKIRNSKSKIRAILKDVCTAIAGAKSEISIPEEAFKDDCVDTDKICCAVCGSTDSSDPNNDILLCDRMGCNKAFHQKCLTPHVTDCGGPDDDWYCHRCQCHFDCLVIINEHFDTEFDDWTEVFPNCDKTVEVNSPRVPIKKSKSKQFDFVCVKCPKGHDLEEFFAGDEDDDMKCDKCGVEIEEDDHFFSCKTCEKENEDYDICNDCAHGRESRRYAGEGGKKRPPKRKAAKLAEDSIKRVDNLRMIGKDEEKEEEKEEEEEEEEEEDWGSDSGSDFEVVEDEDEDDEDEELLKDFDDVETELTSPRGRGRRKKKKIDYVALAGELGFQEGEDSDGDRDFTSTSRLSEQELNFTFKDLMGNDRKKKK